MERKKMGVALKRSRRSAALTVLFILCLIMSNAFPSMGHAASFRVKAGNSAQTTIGSAQTPDMLLVSNVPAATGGAESLTVTGATAGALLKLYTSIGGFVASHTLGAAETSYTFTAVAPGFGYYATETVGGVESTNTNTVTVKPVAVIANGGVGQVPVSGATAGADLKLFAFNGAQVGTTHTLAAGQTTHTFTGVAPGTNYYVTQTVNGVESVASNQVTVAPDIVTVSGGISKVDVSNATAGAALTLYATNGTAEATHTLDASSTTHSFTGVAGVFYVTQRVNGVESLGTSYVTATPSAPALTGGVGQVSVSGAKAGADLKLFAFNGTQVGTTHTLGAGETTHTFMGVAPGTNYYVTQSVSGVVSAGSNLVTVSPAVVTASGGAAQVSVSGATAGAVLTLYKGNGTVADSYTLGAIETTYSFSGVEPGINYYVTQRVNGVESDGSNLVTVSPVAMSATGGVESMTVTGATAGAVLKLYTFNGSFVTSNTLGAAETSYTFTAVAPGLGYYATQTVGGVESLNTNMVTVKPVAVTVNGGEGKVDVSNAAAGAVLTLYATNGTVQATHTLDASSTTHSFTGVAGVFYVTQTVNGAESLGTSYVTATPAAPALTGGVGQVSVSGAKAGADLKLFAFNGTQVGTTHTLGAGETTHTFTGVAPGTNYYVTQSVSGVVSAGSNLVTVSPAVVTASGGAAQVPVSGATAGAVLTLYKGNGTVADSYTLGAAETTYSFSGVEPGTNYYVTQRVNGVESDGSNLVTVSPVAMSATGGAESVTVTGATAGALLKLYTFNGSFVTSNTLGAAETSYTFTGVTPGFGYYATQTVGGVESLNTNTVTVKPAAVNAIGGAGKVDVSGATGGAALTLYAQNGTVAATHTLGAGETSYSFTGITPGASYYATQTVNGVESTASQLVAVGYVPPGIPFLQTPVAGDGQVTLSWTQATDSTGYKIFASETSGSYGAAVATVNAATTQYDVTGLTNGTTYYFVVKATNPDGDSSASNEQSAMPKGVPTAPVITSAKPGDGQVTIRFTTPASDGGSPITSYTVTANPGSISKTAAGSPIIVTGLTNGTTYTFTVTATNQFGDSPASNAVTAKPQTPATIVYVTEVQPPAPVTGRPNGTAKTAEALGLPTQVGTVLNDGSNLQIDVSWDIDATTYDPDMQEEQTFAVTGNLVNLPVGVTNTLNLTASIQVTVNAATSEAREIVRVSNPPAITGVANGTPKKAAALGLPAQAKAWLNDGSSMLADVKWDIANAEYDPKDKQAQTFTVIGELVNLPDGVTNSQNVTVNVEVTVDATHAGEIVAVAKQGAITGIPNGTPKEAAALGLPAKVEATLENGSTVQIEVEWDLVNADYDPKNEKAQTFRVVGELVNLPDGITNSQNLTASIQVSVKAADDAAIRQIVKVTDPDDIRNVENGTRKTAAALGLPNKVEVTLDDDSEMFVNVKWDVEDADYNPNSSRKQRFAVNGELVNLPDDVENPQELGAVVKVTVDAAPRDNDRDDDNGGGGSYSNGKDNSPRQTVRQVNVEAGTDSSLAEQLDIIRKTYPDGKKVDEVVLGQKQATDILKKAAANGKDIVRILVTDLPDDPADEVAVKIPGNVLKLLQEQQVSLEIRTGDVTITLSKETLAAHPASELFFRIVPINRAKEKKATAQRAIQAEEVQRMANGQGVEMIGKPMIIEANYSNHPTKVMFPLQDATLPADPAAMRAFLETLAVYVEHTDGEKELKTGEIHYDESGNPVGIEIGIDKFSTFTILSFKGKQADHKPYMSGYPDQTFKPNRALTRAEMASILAHFLQPSSSQAHTIATFADVQPNHWAASAIQQVYSAGLMSGDRSGLFRPDANMTRAEMAAVIVKWKQLAQEQSVTMLADTQGHWAEAMITAVEQQGYMKGYQDGTFRPNQELTRAEAVALFNRLTGRGPLQTAMSPQYKDVPASHWAFAEIVEATLPHTAGRQENGTEVISD